MFGFNLPDNGSHSAWLFLAFGPTETDAAATDI